MIEGGGESTRSGHAEAAVWSLSLDFVSPSSVLEPCLFSGGIRNLPPGETSQSLPTPAAMGRRQPQVPQNVATCFLW